MPEKQPDVGEACSPDLKNDLIETDRGSPTSEFLYDFNELKI